MRQQFTIVPGNLHCEKSLFVLAFHQKIPLPRIENPAADTRKFFPPPIDLFYIPHGRKFFWSLEGDLLHSQMPEKSSGPWNETFYIPPCHKSLASGGRPCLAPGTRISRHWEMQKPSRDPKRLEDFSGMGTGKKATARTSCCNIHNTTTPTREEPTTSETQASTWVPARA
jgi:hypothetical protein